MSEQPKHGLPADLGVRRHSLTQGAEHTAGTPTETPRHKFTLQGSGAGCSCLGSQEATRDAYGAGDNFLHEVLGHKHLLSKSCSETTLLKQ